MSFQVTSLATAIFALMLVPLSFQISLRRLKLRTASPDAKDETLRRRIRAHGNFSEYAPMMLIVLALVEYNGAPPALTWSLGAAFIASRVAHAVGMLYTSGPTLRGPAMMVQHAAFVVAGGWLLLQALG